MAASLLAEIAKNGQAFQESHSELERQRTIAAASALIQELENPGEQLARIGWEEPSRTAALRTAFELGLLGKLGSAPLSSAQLAEGTKADPELIARVMKHLAAFRLVKEAGKDAYCATPFTQATADPGISGGLIYSFEGMIPTFHAIPDFLARTDYQVPRNAADGPLQAGLRTTDSMFEYFGKHPRLAQAFNNFLGGYAKVRPRWTEYYPAAERLEAPDADSGPLLVDIGGGLGGDISALHAACPQLRGRLVLQDQASVIEQVKALAPPLPAAIEPVAHDFFTAQPESSRAARAYFLRLVLHDWPDEKCVEILSHVRDAMRPGYSRLLLNETVLKDVAAPPVQTSLDWTMMAMLVSRERTESQWRDLLASAGLKLIRVFEDEAARESVIEAVRADD